MYLSQKQTVYKQYKNYSLFYFTLIKTHFFHIARHPKPRKTYTHVYKPIHIRICIFMNLVPKIFLLN